MRYLKCENIVIDTENQLLIRDGESIQLAPKVYDLLIYFCLNHDKIISKDELMDNVWSGTIVTDNAISRTLVKVRKVLADDPKKPQFIITVPKKGYRMVATFSETNGSALTESGSQSLDSHANQINECASHINPIVAASNNSQDKGSNTHSKKQNIQFLIKVALSAFALLILSIYLIPINFQQNETITTKQLTPLTREIAEEQHPNISPDLKLLAYSKTGTGRPSFIAIETINTQQKITVKFPDAALSRPVWSPTDNKLAFLFQQQDSCIIYWAELANIQQLDSWQAISECSKDSWPHFTFSADGQYLYFNDKQSPTSGYQIFRVNLSTLEKDIIKQPITRGLGNYYFDISADGSRLVMLNSEFAPKTQIYTLDIVQSKLKQSAQLPYLMRAVSWHHDNKTIVHPSPHPAYELWQSNLAGEKLAVVASNTSRVKQLSRINNGKDFSFVSYLLNRDIHYAEQMKNTNIELDNSSVMDYLPTLANTSERYAFVSKRSSTAEVYLSTLGANQSKQITFFDNRIKLYHLDFSPSDSQLAILADNQAFIVNTSNLELIELPLNNIAISGLSWQDEDTLLFSTIKNNNWRFMRYKISTQALTAFPKNYQGGIYSSSDGFYYAITQKNEQVMKFKGIDQPVIPTELYCPAGLLNRKLNLQLSANAIICRKQSVSADIQAYDIDKATLRETVWFKDLVGYDFDSKNGRLIYTKMKQSVADIMRTTSN